MSVAAGTGVGVIACGALSVDLKELARERNWDVTVYPLPPLLHNQPQQIAGEVEKTFLRHRSEHLRWAIAYADCGTYGALDHVARTYGLPRLAGDHCYDLYAGPKAIMAEMDQEPGTYFLTDFLVRSFHRTVMVELGLDRYPELREDYFGNYRRVVWLTVGRPGAEAEELIAMAEQAALTLGLPLVVRQVGRERLAREVGALVLSAQEVPDTGVQDRT